MNAPHVEITPARSSADLACAAELFREYAASIGIDLEYQGFSAELAALPGQYSAPGGGLWIARVNGELAGCVAMRALDDSTLEIKRLYVRLSARGSGLGKRLAEAAISAARLSGNKELRLDTLESMTAARALYASLGFTEIRPYGKAYIPGTCFYGLPLR